MTVSLARVEVATACYDGMSERISAGCVPAFTVAYAFTIRRSGPIKYEMRRGQSGSDGSVASHASPVVLSNVSSLNGKSNLVQNALFFSIGS